MKLLLDTNIVLYYLSGDERLMDLLDGIEVHMSFITVVELLSYPQLNHREEEGIREFLKSSSIISESESLREQTIKIRKEHKLKLPDAFIAATSMMFELPLISADKVFSKVDELLFIDYEI